MHDFSKNKPLGGLDYDSSNYTIDPLSYRFGRNLRNALNAANRGGCLTNVKGNLEVTKYTLPYNGDIFPVGKNRVIGSVEDTKYNTVVYFVWNQFGKHQILRYYRDLTTPDNPFGEIQQVIQYDFGWKKSTKIDSANIVYGTQEAGADSELTGDLLYWCDKKPKKINLTKANVCTKLKCWDVRLPITTDGNISATTTFNFKNFSGATVYNKTVNTSGQIVLNGVFADFTSGVPYDTIIFYDNIDFSGVSQFTISGATINPSNNKTYDIISVTNDPFASHTVVKVGVAIGAVGVDTVDITFSVAQGSRETIIRTIADAFNSDNSSPVTAEYCDCQLELCEKVNGTVWTITTDQDAILLPAKNWYGATLIDRFFDRCKYPPLQAPQPTFEQDTNYEPNYVQKKVFQFRLEYDYDDLERSALGVWSQIPINNLSCDGTSNPAYNYIDVNFNDSLIASETTLVVLKHIRFIARELNTGKDRAVIDLDVCDFLDYKDGEWVCHFKFYNDIISNPVDDATAAKLFDNVPLESNDERFVKNRIVEGGILEGYDTLPCIDAKVQMEFSDNPNPKLYKITGRIRVLTYSLVGTGYGTGTSFYDTIALNNQLRKYPFWESSLPYINARVRRGGIFHNLSETDSVPFFGGGGFAPNNGVEINNFAITQFMEQYDQRLPEGGFPIYAAGTNYFTISKQKNVGLPIDSIGALDISTSDKVENIGSYLFSNYDTTNPPTTDLYSEFEMLVPEGTYVIRLASHWCSFGDKIGKGFAYDLSAGNFYQKTSTNVWSVIDPNGTQLMQKEITVTVSGGDVFIGDFLVADLSSPYGIVPSAWRTINGYLVSDENDSSDINSQAFSGEATEKTIVTFGRNGTDYYMVAGSGSFLSGIYDTGWQNSCITDCNGYFFGINGASLNEESATFGPDYYKSLNFFPLSAYQCNWIANPMVRKIRDFDTLLYTGNYSDYVNKVLVPINYNGFVESFTSKAPLIHCFIATTAVNTRELSSTQINGTIVDQNGNGIGGVLAVYQNGKIETTQPDGTYSIRAWSDMLTPNMGLFSSQTNTFVPVSFSDRVVDYLIINGTVFCGITYPNGQSISILISTFGNFILGQYNPQNPYLAGTFAVDESNNPAIKAHKRGGKYIYGIRMYDVAGRLCSVMKATEVYVPFVTEDIGNYSIENFQGALYGANTFKYGKPSLKFALSAQTIFPSWVSTIQLMRTKNSIYGRYLQWIANQVTYLSAVRTATTPEIETSFQNVDAVAIKISIKNIIDYSSQNPDSTIGYTYEAGDRLRLMYDRSLNPINGLNDFEITSFDSDTQSIIIKPDGFSQEILSGSMIEIFNPKSVETTDEQIYYEVGEVINVVGGLPETYSLVLTNGDTYWRGRNITVNDEATKFASAYPVVIEDASVSDFYSSEAQDIGRIGLVDPAFKQVYAPTKVRCSNQFIPSTAINGLSAFEELNQKEFDRANGQIERLLVRENTIIAVTSLREISNYIQVVTFEQAAIGNGVLAIANQYFGTEYPHAKRLGTDLPSSVLVNDGIAFGIQSKRGEAWRYQGDGEITISDAKMINYFYQLEIDGVVDATSVYDRKHEEYITTLWRNYTLDRRVSEVYADGVKTVITVEIQENVPPPDTEAVIQYKDNGVWVNVDGVVLGGTTPNILFEMNTASYVGNIIPVGTVLRVVYALPETIAWFNGVSGATKERWLTFYSFTPEKYEQLGSEVVMFKDGKLWLGDVNPLYNNFFGVQYKTDVIPVFNKQPEELKVWNSVVLQQLQANGGCNWSCPNIQNDNGQLSRLNNAGFVKKGEIWYAPFKRDLTDVTVPQNLRISQGRALRSTTLVCEMQNNSTGEILLYSWDANFTLSERTGK